jgi:hypothetical protein
MRTSRHAAMTAKQGFYPENCRQSSRIHSRTVLLYVPRFEELRHKH